MFFADSDNFGRLHNITPYVPPLITKSIYRYGLESTSCLLRSICEIAETPVYYNGLIGELLHVIFT
jgi:hypothetical protein